MANREQSDAADETFPGPGPSKADETKRGLRPVEQMVDAAIDRIAREQQAARDAGQQSGANSAEPGHAITRVPVDEDGSWSALATAASARRARGRLRWKGLDVSDEFRSYAERVARGEDLAPFQGKILAEPDPAFPWDPTQQRRAQSRALKRQLGLWTGVALFLGACVWVLVVQVGNQNEAAQRAAESPLATVVLGNQPEAPKLDVAAQPSAAEEASAAQADDTGPSGTAAAQGTTALASLQERTAPAAAKAPMASVPAAAGAPRLAATPASPVGTLVATRSPTGELPVASANAAASVRTQPALDLAASSNAQVPGATATSGAGNGAPAAGTSAASATAAAANPAAAGPVATNSAASMPADPKKEPGREASAMGHLLVENPSF